MKLEAELRLYRQTQNISTRACAQTLNISPAYLSLIEGGKRAISLSVKAKIEQLLEGYEPIAARRVLTSRLETQLDRPLNTAEEISLAREPSLFESLLSRLENKSRAESPDRKIGEPGDAFEIATALSGLQSIAEILAEEPDLDAPQRQRFVETMSSQANRLATLLAIDPSEGEQTEISTQRSDLFVDQYFQAKGYYFPELESEADLIVRRTRRHGPLGTFSLVQRLETDLGIEVVWQEGSGMAPSSSGFAALQTDRTAIYLDPSLGEAQLRFRLAQFLVARECKPVLDRFIQEASVPNEDAERDLRRALIAYTAAAMVMPYDSFLRAAEQQRYDIDWLSRHFACSFDQVCHRLIALRKPGNPGVPFGMLRTSPAGHTLSRISLPGLAMPDQRAACPLWAAYAALQRPGETVTQLAEFPDTQTYLFIGRTAAGPRAHFGQPRRLTSVMLMCDWAYAADLIYADNHDLQRDASITEVGYSCGTCPRQSCQNRVASPR